MTRSKVYCGAVLSGLVLGVSVARAQAQSVSHSSPTAVPASAALGTLIGSAIDSLHDAPLADAVVTIVQLPRKSAITSNTGAFKIDSIPPGRYTIEILHPVLDSLRIRVVSDTIDIAAGATQVATLGIPSGETLVASLCSPLDRKMGPGVLVGQVLDAESNAPVEGAEVSVAWVETNVSPTSGVETSPRLRKTKTDAGGIYRICGIPLSLNGTLQASRGVAETGAVDVAMGAAPLFMRFLRLSTAQPAVVRDTGGVQPLRSGPGVVTGRVTNRGGAPVKGARVFVTGSVARAQTSADGTFTLKSVPLGTQAVEVHGVGYTPTHVALDVNPRGPNTLVVRLATLPPQLPAVNVASKATKSQLDKVGFDHRKKMGFGKFMTEADIEKAQPVYTSDVLRLINGLHVVGSGSDLTVTSSRGETCVQYMIDRHYVDAGAGLSIDELVNPTDIVGLEFYQASDVPMAFDSPRISGCGLLIIWTRAQVKESGSSK
jgi:protocatechuate 3,4-dioxygenase beta subunit